MGHFEHPDFWKFPHQRPGLVKAEKSSDMRLGQQSLREDVQQLRGISLEGKGHARSCNKTPVSVYVIQQCPEIACDLRRYTVSNRKNVKVRLTLQLSKMKR